MMLSVALPTRVDASSERNIRNTLTRENDQCQRAFLALFFGAVREELGILSLSRSRIISEGSLKPHCTGERQSRGS